MFVVELISFVLPDVVKKYLNLSKGIVWKGGGGVCKQSNISTITLVSWSFKSQIRLLFSNSPRSVLWREGVTMKKQTSKQTLFSFYVIIWPLLHILLLIIDTSPSCKKGNVGKYQWMGLLLLLMVLMQQLCVCGRNVVHVVFIKSYCCY